MNPSETYMLDLLKKGRDEFGVVAVKAEFEAEGTRPDEFMRLLELARRADLKVALKIGGCEAISDLLVSKLYGVDYIIAPMIETHYALSKFIDAKNKTYGTEKQHRTEFLFNVETESALSNLDKMVPLCTGELHGIVFGRVDFTLSCGLARTAVNDRRITDAVLEVAHTCAERDLELVVGGSVSTSAIGALREIQAVRLDRFETRKVIFEGSAVARDNIAEGIQNAVDFELEWLKNKRDYYQAIAQEDAARIKMMEDRKSTVQPRLLSKVA